MVVSNRFVCRIRFPPTRGGQILVKSITVVAASSPGTERRAGPTQTAVVRKNARRRLESSSEHAALELLTHDTNRKLFPVLASLDPGGTIDTAKPSPGRELFLLILRGTIEIDDDVTPRSSSRKGTETA